MTERNENVIRTTETLLQDLHYADEWDVPAKLYMLADDPEDPTARLIGQLAGHPAKALEAIFMQGFHPSDKVHGLIVTTEAYRHYTFDEIVAEHPEVLERMTEIWKADGSLKDDDDPLARMKTFYYEGVLPSLPDASTLPDNMRKEIRVAAVVLRDGTSFSGATTRGGEAAAEVKVMPKEVLCKMHVPNRMYQLLHDVQPTECDDPIQRVLTQPRKSEEDS